MKDWTAVQAYNAANNGMRAYGRMKAAQAKEHLCERDTIEFFEAVDRRRNAERDLDNAYAQWVRLSKKAREEERVHD